MVKLALLECFDTTAEPEAAGPPLPSEDWRAGHSAGYAEGHAAALTGATVLRSETANALADLAFSHHAANSAAMLRLAPLLRMVADHIVPRMLRDTFGAMLCERLIEAARQDMARPVVLHVSPGDLEPVRATIALLSGEPFNVIADPRLPDGQALIGTGDGETAFDFNRLASDLTAAIAALCDDTTRREASA